MEPSELDEWANAVATALGVPVAEGQVGAVLDLARDAAHAVARPAAPVTTYLAGIAVGRGQSLDEVVKALGPLLEERAT
jgi:hypothetical protein